MKKFSDLSREVDEDLERKIQELYDTYGEIDEALIKRLNLQGPHKKSEENWYSHEKNDEESSVQTKDCKIKETYEIYCTTFGQGIRNKQEIK